MSLWLGPQMLKALWVLLRCISLGHSLKSFSSRAALATEGCADDSFCLSVLRKNWRGFFDDAVEYGIKVG